MFFGFVLVFGLAAGGELPRGLGLWQVVGEAEVDAGGTFEAMIGLGYAGGPRLDCWGLGGALLVHLHAWRGRHGFVGRALPMLLASAREFLALEPSHIPRTNSTDHFLG